MGCWISKKVYKFPKDGLHLYSKDGRMLYTLIYSDECEYLLMNSVSHDVVKLCRIDNMCTVCTGMMTQCQCNATSKVSLSNLSFRNGKEEVYDNLRLGGMGNDHIVIDGWVSPGWWISACWFFMFDETHKKIMSNNFLVSAHYLRIELSKMTLTRQHKKMGIEYLVSIGTFCNGESNGIDGELTVFSEVMYGLR